MEVIGSKILARAGHAVNFIDCDDPTAADQAVAADQTVAADHVVTAVPATIADVAASIAIGIVAVAGTEGTRTRCLATPSLTCSAWPSA